MAMVTHGLGASQVVSTLISQESARRTSSKLSDGEDPQKHSKATVSQGLTRLSLSQIGVSQNKGPPRLVGITNG